MADSYVAKWNKHLQKRAEEERLAKERLVKALTEQVEPTRKRLKSPISAIYSDSAPPKQGEPSGRPFAAEKYSDTQPPPRQRRTHRRHTSTGLAFSQEPETDDLPASIMTKQPETRPISQEQLVAEVKGIYAGLVMVESKCIEVDSAQFAQTDGGARLNNEQWQALITLHRTLLHEHHDFFLASQHPSASPALRKLASKYAMPARIWRHGIHSFLELLRHRLPASLEHKLAFLYMNHTMMATCEQRPAHEDFWLAFLGILDNYPIAFEETEARYRDICEQLWRIWYDEQSGKALGAGKLHSLARDVGQLHWMLRWQSSNICRKPVDEDVWYDFCTAQGCVQGQGLAYKGGLLRYECEVHDKYGDTKKGHDCPFINYKRPSGKCFSRLENLKEHLRRIHTSNGVCSMSLRDSSPEHCHWGGKRQHDTFQLNKRLDYLFKDPFEKTSTSKTLGFAGFDPLCGVSISVRVYKQFGHTINTAVLVNYQSSSRCEAPEALPFSDGPSSSNESVRRVQKSAGFGAITYTWHLGPALSNCLTKESAYFDRLLVSHPAIESNVTHSHGKPLPEDWNIRGLLWAKHSWLSDEVDKVDKGETSFQLSMDRVNRVLWLSNKLAFHEQWIVYGDQMDSFLVLGSQDEKDESRNSASRKGAGSFRDTLMRALRKRATIGKSILSNLARKLTVNTGTRLLKATY